LPKTRGRMVHPVNQASISKVINARRRLIPFVFCEPGNAWFTLCPPRSVSLAAVTPVSAGLIALRNCMRTSLPASRGRELGRLGKCTYRQRVAAPSASTHPNPYFQSRSSSENGSGFDICRRLNCGWRVFMTTFVSRGTITEGTTKANAWPSTSHSCPAF